MAAIKTWESTYVTYCSLQKGHMGNHQSGWYDIGNTPSGRAAKTYYVVWQVRGE